MEDDMFFVYVSLVTLSVVAVVSLWIGSPVMENTRQSISEAATTALLSQVSSAYLQDAHLATEQKQDAELARGVEVRGEVVPTSTKEHASNKSVLPITHTTKVLTSATPKKVVATSQVAVPDVAIDLSALALRIHELTNAERKKEGIAPLAYDNVLARNARRYSESMQQHDLLSHTDVLGCDMTCRFSRDRYVALSWGENLARWRSSYQPTLEEMATYFVREWKKSSGHRDNLLSESFTQEGVGVVMEGTEIYVTVHFSQKSDN